MSDDKPQEKPVETKPLIKECGCSVEIPIIDDPHKVETKPVEKPVETKLGEVDTKNLQNYNEAMLKIKDLESKIAGIATPKPEAQITTSENNAFNLKESASHLFEDIAKTGRHIINIGYDELRNYGVGKVKTANGVRESFSANYVEPTISAHITETASGVTQSGTAPGIAIDPAVAVVPGGITFAPTRQFAKYKSIPQGQNIARFFKTSLPSTGSQTAGTTATAATQTITAVDITPSTVTGVYQLVDTDKMEDEPYDLLQTVLNSAMATVLNFEAVDMLTTVSAEGTLTPGAWLNGNTGATTANSEVSGIFKRLGISKSKQYLSNQGYLRSGVRPVAFIHPKQMEELTAEDTTISTWVQYANPGYTAEGYIPSIDGVDLVVTNAIQAKSNTTNNVYDAIVCVPQHSYGAASKRDVQVKIHDIGEDNQLRVNVTWRYKTGVIDATSIVRVSSVQ